MKDNAAPSSPPGLGPGPTARKPLSRPRVARRLGAVFLIGWLLSFLLFGLEAPGRALVSPAWPILFGVQSLNGDFGLALICFGATFLTGGFIAFSVIRRRLVWLTCAALALYWVWTFSLLAIPF